VGNRNDAPNSIGAVCEAMMGKLPSLDELLEEHWSIVVLAHRLAEASVVSPPPPELPELIEQLHLRCDAHFSREERLLRNCRVGPVDGLVACQRYLRHLLNLLRPASPGNSLAATMVAFEAALIMTLQHDRAVLSALHGLPSPSVAAVPWPEGALE